MGAEEEGGRVEEELEELPPPPPSPTLPPNLDGPPFAPPTGFNVAVAEGVEEVVVVVVAVVEERIALRTLFPPRSTSLRVFRGAAEAFAEGGEGKEEEESGGG